MHVQSAMQSICSGAGLPVWHATGGVATWRMFDCVAGSYVRCTPPAGMVKHLAAQPLCAKCNRRVACVVPLTSSSLHTVHRVVRHACIQMNRIANLLAYYTNDDEQKHARIAVDMHGHPAHACAAIIACLYCTVCTIASRPRPRPRPSCACWLSPPVHTTEQACLIGYLAYVHGFGNHARYVCYVTGLQLTHVTCCADI